MPGKWYLRHVGFLGAAAPAVKGLKPVEFADDGGGVVFADLEFAEGLSPWTLDGIGRLLDYPERSATLVEEEWLRTARRARRDFEPECYEFVMQLGA